MAQSGGLGFDDLIYLLVVVLSMLGGFGKWIRDRSASKTAQLQELGKTPKGSPPTRQAPDRTATGRPIPAAQRRPAAPAQAKLPQSIQRIVAQVFESETQLEEGTPAETIIVAKPAGQPVARRRQIKGTSQPPRGKRKKRPAKPPPPKPSRAEEMHAVTELLSQGVSTSHRRGGLGNLTSLSIAELRRAIVLNEILGPPVALRDAPGSVVGRVPLAAPYREG